MTQTSKCKLPYTMPKDQTEFVQSLYSFSLALIYLANQAYIKDSLYLRQKMYNLIDTVCEIARYTEVAHDETVTTVEE